MVGTSARRSAEDVVGFRAIETLKPEGERIVSDPYARLTTVGHVDLNWRLE
jgi:hypothetical protein